MIDVDEDGRGSRGGSGGCPGQRGDDSSRSARSVIRSSRCGRGSWRLPEREERLAMQAVWNETVIAESDDSAVVQGNHYLPVDAIKSEHFEPSSTTTVCRWKGTASYYTLVVEGARNEGGARSVEGCSKAS